MKRTSKAGNTVAHAFENWDLCNVSILIDCVCDGEPPQGRTWEDIEKAARSDLRMMPRLCKLAQAIFDKYERGELTAAEARALNGTTDEEP